MIFETFEQPPPVLFTGPMTEHSLIIIYKGYLLRDDWLSAQKNWGLGLETIKIVLKEGRIIRNSVRCLDIARHLSRFLLLILHQNMI